MALVNNYHICKIYSFSKMKEQQHFCIRNYKHGMDMVNIEIESTPSFWHVIMIENCFNERIARITRHVIVPPFGHTLVNFRRLLRIV